MVHKLLGLLMVPSQRLQLLLLRQIVKGSLHAPLIVKLSHLVWYEATYHSFIHTVGFWIMVEILVKLLIHHQVLSLGCHWYAMVHAWMTS